MALLYTLTIKKSPEHTNVEDYPPQIIDSVWYRTLKSRSILLSSNTKSTRRGIYFKDISEATSWFLENKLNDSALISVLNEWKTAHSITYEECWHEMPVYSAEIPSLLS